MTEQLPPIDIGKPQDATAEGDNPFQQFVTQDEQPPSLYERAKDTAVAHWYSDTLTGSYAGALQADQFRIPKAEEAGAMAGDIIGAKQNGELKLTPDQDYDLRLIKANNPNTPKLTDAQIAQMRNAAYPEATTFGEKAADIAGAIAGSMGSPEAVLVPAVRAEAAIASMAPKMVELMPGLAKRMVQTGAEQMVVSGLSNPFIQSNRIGAGLQREFDPYEMATAPIEGFVAGAALHGMFEVAGMGAKAGVNALKNSTAAQSIMAGFERRLQENFFRQLKEVEPGFVSPDDATNMPRSMDGLFPKKEAAAAEVATEGAGAPPSGEVTGEVTTMPGAGEEAAGGLLAAEAAPATEAAVPLPSDDPTFLNGGRQKLIQEPQTLLGFVRAEGGVQDWKGELRSQDMHKRYPGLVRKGGKTLDMMREAAQEAGYLPENSTPDDLVQALLSDEPVYSHRDFDQAQAFKLQEKTREVERAIKAAKDDLSEAYPGVQQEVVDEVGYLVAHEGLSQDQAFDVAISKIALEEPRYTPDEELGRIFDEWADTRAKSEADRAARGSGAEASRRGEGEAGSQAGQGASGEAGGAGAEAVANDLPLPKYIAGKFKKTWEALPKAEAEELLKLNETDRYAVEDRLAELKDEMNWARAEAIGGTVTPAQDLTSFPSPENELGSALMNVKSGGSFTHTQSGHPTVQFMRQKGLVSGKAGKIELTEEGRAVLAEWGGYGEVAGPKLVALANEFAPEATFEAGAEGKPQAVIPGAERASDKTMAERQANAPMRGGNAPAGGMFDEANTAQPDLQFRRAPSYPPNQAQAAALADRAAGVVKSLHDQAFDLAALIGRPLRTGRVDAGALGQYQASSGVARIRAIDDFDTVVHELGHGLEEKLGDPLRVIIGRHALELMPLDPNGTNDPLEGFAEWMIPFIQSPNGTFAHRIAPNFARDFLRHLLDHEPTLYEALMKARESYANYINGSSVERGAAVIVPMEKQGWFSGLAETYKRNGLGQTIGRVLADSYTSIFDQFDPLHRSVRDLARMAKELNGGTPIDLKAADNPEVLLRMVFNRAAQGSYHQMRYGIVPYKGATSVGPSLYDAIALATGQGSFMGKWDNKGVTDFSEFLTAKRALVLWDEFNAGNLPNKPTSLHQADWQQIHADLLAANPNFDRASQMVHDYTRNMLDKLLDAGIIKKELHDELVKTPFYVPMFRDMSDKPMAGNPGGGANAQGPGMTNLVKKMRGSGRDIIDPLQSIMQQTYLAERTIRHNDLIQSLVNLAHRAGSPSGYLVEELKPKDIKQQSFDLTEAVKNAAIKNGVSPTDTAMMMSTIVNVFGKDPVEGQIFWREPTKANGEPIVFYKDAGELKAVRFSTKHEGRALYETVMSMPSQAQDVYLELLAGTSSIARAGIVLHPSYFLSNMIRDQVATFLIRPDFIPGWDAIKGVRSELTQDDYSKMYAYIGGQSAGGYVNEPTGRMDVSDLNTMARRSFVQQHTGSLLALAEVTQLSESGTRNSIFAKTYEKALSNGLSPYEAMIEASWAGTDILDFSRHGSRMEATRRIIPFLNSTLQGLDKLRRALYEPLARGARGDVLTMQEQQDVSNAWAMMAKMTLAMPVFGAMWAGIHSGSETYRDADPKRKATHFVFGLGRFEADIPKPFELALPFTLGEHAYEAFMNKDPRAAGNFATAAHETLVPPNPLTSIPMVNEYYQQKTGMDLYTGRPIVPEGLQKFSPDMQFNDRTSPTAIVIANVLNGISDKMGQGKPWSPIKVEHFFGGGFGTMGREVMAAGHWFSPNGNDLPSSLDQSFILRRFIKDPTRSSDTIQRYYQHVAEKTGDYNTSLAGYNDAVKQHDMTTAQQIYRGLSEDRKAFIVLNAGGDEEGQGVFDAEAKKTHPLTRARLAVQQLNGLARELASGKIANTETDEAIKMTPEMRRSALDAVHQLAALEMRNSLVMTKEPGYENRPIADVSKQFAIINAASPELAEEVARRYATAKVYKTEAVAKEWPTMKRALVRSGSEADISDNVGNVTDEGFEFGGEHIARKRQKREPIAGDAMAQ